MTERGPAIEDIKREAQARIGEVLAALGIHDRPSPSGYISMCNPVVKDRHPSFTIWTKGAIGAWRDERNRGPGGDQGDVIDLVSYVKGWWTMPKKGRAPALRWLTDTLGLAVVDRAQLQRDRERARRQQLENQKKRDEELEGKRALARMWFINACAQQAGSPAAIYLKAARAIDLDALPRGPRGGSRWPHCIRSLHDFNDAARHTESGKSLPCMIACCTDTGTREILAVHRTWLKPDASGKADVFPDKKVFPAYAGLIIPLWRGDSGLSVTEANAAGLRETLVLTEGIEDGLTAVLAAPQFRTWAFIALGNLGGLVLPDCVDGVILHRQTEWANRTAVSAFERGKAAIEAQGRAVAEVTAFAGKDLNDTLRGAA